MNLSVKIEQELRDIDNTITRIRAKAEAEVDLLRKRRELLKVAQRHVTKEIDQLLEQLGVNIVS